MTRKFDVTMKLSRRPQYVVTVTAESKENAVRIAREMANAEGFFGYAITRIVELPAVYKILGDEEC